MDRQKLILAVDDVQANLEILRELLGYQYEVVTANNGHDALAIAARRRPDLVLLDVRMPKPNGYEICRTIKQTSELRNTKVLLVSALGTREERLAGYAAGADDYIVKPFDEEELRAKIGVYLRLKSVEEVDNMKARVIEVLQHGARTPLTAIISYAEILQEGLAATRDDRQHAIGAILSSAKRMLRLLKKSERLASMKSRQYTFDFQPVMLDQLVRSNIDRFRDLAATENIALIPEIQEEMVAHCDAQQISFVLGEILDNAIRHSPSGSLVTITAKRRRRHFTITVADEGPGIDPKVLPALFHEFADPEAIVHNHGDGLSLALARQVMLAHDGVIFAQSEKGYGATFTLSLPVVNSPQAAEVVTTQGQTASLPPGR